MADWSLKTPVALLIYKRPSTTEKVFEAIRQAKPPQLLVIANAPRPDQPGEAEKCAATRAIIDRVDWDCQVFKNYADTFLSCKDRISSGLDWVFETVDRAIVLEDDCVPDPSFFRFCDEMLERYQDDERVTSIAGTSYQIQRQRSQYSYYFSHYNLLWGWATWRRVWQHYDVNMKLWPEIRDSGWLVDCLGNEQTANHWSRSFERTYNGFDTWDDQWVLSCWIQSGLSIVPNVNLVSNIGFGNESTHTKDSFDWRAAMPTAPIAFPLKHPEFVIRDVQADIAIQERYYNWLAKQRTLVERAKRKVRRAQKLVQDFRQGDQQGDLRSLITQLIRE